jgi:hypothetical protein
MEHYPVIPSNFANLTDVSSPPFHDGLWDLPICGIDVIGGVRANQALQFNAVVPKAFWGAPVLIFLRETVRLSSQMQPSAACCQGEYGSVMRI